MRIRRLIAVTGIVLAVGVTIELLWVNAQTTRVWYRPWASTGLRVEQASQTRVRETLLSTGPGMFRATVQYRDAEYWRGVPLPHDLDGYHVPSRWARRLHSLGNSRDVVDVDARGIAWPAWGFVEEDSRLDGAIRLGQGLVAFKPFFPEALFFPAAFWFAVHGTWLVFRQGRMRWRRGRGLCPRCAYQLRHGGACPECGASQREARIHK